MTWESAMAGVDRMTIEEVARKVLLDEHAARLAAGPRRRRGMGHEPVAGR
jgi:hypothetical protein